MRLFFGLILEYICPEMDIYKYVGIKPYNGCNSLLEQISNITTLTKWKKLLTTIVFLKHSTRFDPQNISYIIPAYTYFFKRIPSHIVRDSSRYYNNTNVG